MRKLLSLFISVLLLLGSLQLSVFGSTITAFRDIPPTRWSYAEIMEMTEMGLFTGTSAPVNGAGEFSPHTSMTRAEFITVITRYACPGAIEEKLAMNMDTGIWYSIFWSVAVDNGLLLETDFGGIGGMEEVMTREEMAYVMANTLSYFRAVVKDEDMVAWESIPDIVECNEFYRQSVHACYSLGLLKGMDANGTFAPMGTLTREQGAVVLHRLIEYLKTYEPADLESSQAGEVKGVDYGLLTLDSSIYLEPALKSDYLNVNSAYFNGGSISMDYTITNMLTASYLVLDGIEYTAPDGYYYLVCGIKGTNSCFTDLSLDKFSFVISDGVTLDPSLSNGTLLFLDSMDISYLSKSAFDSDSTFDGVLIYELPLEIFPLNYDTFVMGVSFYDDANSSTTFSYARIQSDLRNY